MTNDTPRKLVYDHTTGLTEYLELTPNELQKYEQELKEFQAGEQKAPIGG